MRLYLFFFNDTATTEIYTLSLHDALPISLAERAEREMHRGQGGPWQGRMEAERANLRAALAWLEATGDPEPFLRLAAALWFFWYVRGPHLEGRGWFPPCGGRASNGTRPY